MAAHAFTTADALVFEGIVENSCPTDMVVNSTTTCLVEGWLVTDADGVTDAFWQGCGDAETSFLVPAGGSIGESYLWGTMTAGAYVMEPAFGKSPSTLSTWAFTVN